MLCHIIIIIHKKDSKMKLSTDSFIKYTVGIIVFGIAMFLANKSKAQPQPLVCPPRNSIIQYGISPFMVQDSGGNWYGGFLSQGAGTMDFWTFIFGGIPAPDRTTAFNKLVDALPTIQIGQGPTQVNANQWQCIYPNLYNYMAVAITPPLGCTQCANPQ
jgi:hypothetical protein